MPSNAPSASTNDGRTFLRCCLIFPSHAATINKNEQCLMLAADLRALMAVPAVSTSSDSEVCVHLSSAVNIERRFTASLSLDGKYLFASRKSDCVGTTAQSINTTHCHDARWHAHSYLQPRVKSLPFVGSGKLGNIAQGHFVAS